MLQVMGQCAFMINCFKINILFTVVKNTGLKKLERGISRLTNIDYIQRQGFLGVPPILSFVGFTTAIATFGVAHQLGITDEIARIIDQIISKLFVLCSYI